MLIMSPAVTVKSDIVSDASFCGGKYTTLVSSASDMAAAATIAARNDLMVPASR